MFDLFRKSYRSKSCRLTVFVLLALSFLSPVAAQEAETEAAEEDPTYKNFIRWATASEEKNFGFDVYRAEAEEGPYDRLTEKPILGAGTTDEPSHYEFVDKQVDPYKTYWYYVESISMEGERERFSPYVRKKPKLESKPAESESGDDEDGGV